MTSTMRFGICGHPITHTLSPRLFAAAYPQSDYSYELLPASNPEKAIRLFIENGFTGINVTSPLKTSIVPLIHRKTPQCTAIGACNLILKQEDTLVAHNTDYIGVAQSLTEAKISVKNTICLLLGAGGAAKAAAYTLLQSGATLLWANRTPAHIPNPFHGHTPIILPFEEVANHLPACATIINTLPQPIPDTQNLRFTSKQTILDASYSSRPLEQQARLAGARYICGTRWLLYQAIPSFTAMTGIAPNIRNMETCLYPN